MVYTTIRGARVRRVASVIVLLRQEEGRRGGMLIRWGISDCGYDDTRRACTSRRIRYRSTNARGRENGWDEILCDEDERWMGLHVVGSVLVGPPCRSDLGMGWRRVGHGKRRKILL
jgi:hypothetical protein